eukprot:1783794-Amphidinium_carterae.1
MRCDNSKDDMFCSTTTCRCFGTSRNGCHCHPWRNKSNYAGGISSVGSGNLASTATGAHSKLNQVSTQMQQTAHPCICAIPCRWTWPDNQMRSLKH